MMVEQEEPTMVEVDGKYCELGFTLPGQRIGSSAWFNVERISGRVRNEVRRRFASTVLSEARKEWPRNHCVDARR